MWQHCGAFSPDRRKSKCAAERGNTALRATAARSCGVDNWANQRRTPLHCAAANGHSAHGGAPARRRPGRHRRRPRRPRRPRAGASGGHTEDVDGRTPPLARRQGNFSAAGADVTRQQGRRHSTHVWFKIRKPRDSDMFWRTRADVNATAEGEDTPLIFALKHEKGADANVIAKDGDPPLLIATKLGRSAIVTWPLGEGRRHFAPERHQARNAELVHVLDEIGRSLRVAASAEVVWILADAGRDVVLEEAGMEALVASAADGRQETLQALLQLGVNANATYANDGWTVLHVAAWRGHTSCVSMLLKAGALVNVKDECGQTALHVAADNGKSECVVVLLESGADANSPGKDGYTAVDLARQNNHQDCVLEIERRLV
ncbi:Ankyrin repeat, PH and SEC7 domain containing protein [Gryllus bimaculatus]|nr:Ankyrin repeat, PH and SEC7 domain containing protein [Gryllus bimaculatus]